MYGSEPAVIQTATDVGKIKTLAEVEREHFMWVLNHVRVNKMRACDLLGIARTTFYRKLRRYENEQAQQAAKQALGGNQGQR